MAMKRVKAGDPITADGFNRLIDVANAAELNVAQGSGLTLQKGPDGYLLGTSIGLPFWARITGPISSGQYPFVKLYPDGPGTWTDSPTTGTAYEISGNTSVATDTYVKMWSTVAGDHRFLAGSC